MGERPIGEWKFEGAYSGRDKAVLSFATARTIQEYEKSLGFFSAVKRITVQPKPFIEAPDVSGYTDFATDEIKLYLPPNLPLLGVYGKITTMSHELAHHLLEEYFEKEPNHAKLGNDLVHYAVNKNLYQYSKTYTKPFFVLRYGVGLIKVRMFDVKSLAAFKDAIIRDILNGGGQGTHPIWTK